MFYPINKKQKDWQYYTLVLPAVCVGNVGQLAADLLLSTLQMDKIGYIYHESILPLVGNDPFVNTVSTSCNMVTSCEVYEDAGKKLVVVQQRVPLVKGRKATFVAWLRNWILEQNFKQVIILTSSYSHERLDTQLTGSQFRYLSSRQVELVDGDKFRDYNWQQLERRHSLPASPQLESNDGNRDPGTVYIPGGGIAKSLYDECYSDVSLIIMLMFCSEGDNAQDAIQLVNHLNSWLQLVEPKTRLKQKKDSLWKIPASWKLMFGSPVDKTLFH